MRDGDSEGIKVGKGVAFFAAKDALEATGEGEGVGDDSLVADGLTETIGSSATKLKLDSKVELSPLSLNSKKNPAVIAKPPKISPAISFEIIYDLVFRQPESVFLDSEDMHKPRAWL